ncbi:TetR/AcrR family transcriptional regulator [Actinoplanes sp. M2I2]|uniref:TetR/AcrR family transcriptional regulator n=1 Tax=Actinoplanes sp. M2I2 TaxID=1734444 RepID=UPI0020200E1A|nr:TetR/AcrR family transcriptional regulator [Actinoplanes sp. M2I2]
MPQPVKYSADAMLDAVRALVLDGGPSAASVRGVCLATGAPSGSVYHRFPSRDDLLAAAWLRAQDRFLRAYLNALAVSDAPHAIEAAVTVLTWSRDNPDDAALLLRIALRDLLNGELTPALKERAEANQRGVREALGALSANVGHSLRDVALAVVDLPYSVTRRALQNGHLPDEDDIAAVRRAAALLLAH